MTGGKPTFPEWVASLFRDDPARPNPLLAPPALFTFLLLVGGAAVIIGFLNLGNSLRLPFQQRGEVPVQTSGLEELSALKQRDTDGDSLTDYDELYAKGTSPYLRDSDSDGVDDAHDSNPNCPSGQVCTTITSDTTTDQATGSDTTSGAGASTTTDIATLRETLKSAGAPASVIDATDDATLLKLYQEVVAEDRSTAGASANAATNAGSTNLSGGDVTVDVLQNMTAAEIRDLLTANGVDAATLTSFTDSELKAIFNEAIDQEVQSLQDQSTQGQ